MGIFTFTLSHIVAQTEYSFEPSPEFPFGLPNPDAPSQITDWAPLIGEHSCTSVARNANQEWGEPQQMTWRWKYIMNGKGVQDETLKEDGNNSGSIRQFIPDSNSWYVHYYSSRGPTPVLPAWGGNLNEEGKIILYREQKAPNGMDGFYKINFYDIEPDGFKWLGEWVTTDESFSFPTWKIDCKKSSFQTNEQSKDEILDNIRAFSKAYVEGDYDAIADSYSEDGKIMPAGARIIEGKEAIKKRWMVTDGSKILNHEINPSEIFFLGNYAYDYGYYNGKTESSDGRISTWKGKYVIVWKKIDGNWKIYLDIWNRVNENS